MTATQALLVSYAFLFGMVGLSELIRKLWKLPAEFTRKVIHIGVGFWGLLALATLRTTWMAVIPPLSFVFINLVSFRWTLLRSMEIEDRSNLGTVWYPLSLSLLLWRFWLSRPEVVLVGLLAMALGDGMAAIVGRRWGQRAYAVWGVRRSLEGSVALALFAGLGTALALCLATGLGVQVILLRSLIMALVAALLEGLSPRGLDNLTVPLGCGFGYALLWP